MKRTLVACLVAVAVVAFLLLARIPAFTSSPVGDAQAAASSAGNDDLRMLEGKLAAFRAAGGQLSDIRNLQDLADAIKAEAARIKRGETSGGPTGGAGGPVRLDDIDRLNAKIALFASLGGNPQTLGIAGDLRDAIEAELHQLKQNER